MGLRYHVQVAIFCALANACGGSMSAPVDQAELADLGGPIAPARIERSLFYTDTELLDGPGGPTLARTLSTIAGEGQGGVLLAAWFRRFASTAHSERAGPAQLIDAIALKQGADPAAWDLATLPFRVTGVHNRIDLAALHTGGHCGELRVSYSSTDPVYQPMHLLFLFRQPLAEGDVNARGEVTCEGTARRWLALSAADPTSFSTARLAALTTGLSAERFLIAESVEFTVSPWEWRQWVKVADPSGALPFLLDNQPLFQTVEPAQLNSPGTLRQDFLAWVAANADAAEARRIEIPARFRPLSARVVQGVPRPPLSLVGLDAATLTTHPTLRQQLELVGCPACHTADADFVQTRPDRSPSPFYMKELEARRSHLDALGRGEAPSAPFGPLQPNPKLPD